MIAGKRLLPTPLPGLHQPEVVPGFSISRLTAHQFLKARGSFVEFALLCQDNAQKIATAGMAGKNLHRPPQQRLGLDQFALGLTGGAKEAAGIGVHGIHRQGLPIELLRSRHVVGLMMPPGGSE